MAEGSREWGKLSGGGGEGLSMVFFELQGKTCRVKMAGKGSYKKVGDKQ
ncbi:hypothetical protein Tco_0423010, partial [Tanacetum coccineum]